MNLSIVIVVTLNISIIIAITLNISIIAQARRPLRIKNRTKLHFKSATAKRRQLSNYKDVSEPPLVISADPQLKCAPGWHRILVRLG